MCEFPNHTAPSLRRLSLVSLVRRVVTEADRSAHEEFHVSRTPFVGRKGEPLRCVEFIDALRQFELDRNGVRRVLSDETIDEGRDITVDKFSRLPSIDEAGNSHLHKTSAGSGPDCRPYFRAYLGRFDALQKAWSPMSALQNEKAAARLLQNHVQRHFYLSILEARRRTNPTVSRYEWRLPGGSLYVWLPVMLRSWERRAWLEANIEDPDPYRRDEKRRVQDIIDARLAKGKRVDLEECENAGIIADASKPVLPFAVLYGVSTQGLASVVAEEKVASIECQRPAVRSLGPMRLRELILHIFDRLDSGEYNDGKIAARYSLSRATFSRFAGSRWKGTQPGGDGTGAPGDLWVNVAHVLAAHPHFAEAAKAAGVWPRVKKVVQECRPRVQRRTSHVE